VQGRYKKAVNKKLNSIMMSSVFYIISGSIKIDGGKSIIT